MTWQQRARTLKAKGKSLEQIIEQLNSEGFRTKTGVPITLKNIKNYGPDFADFTQNKRRKKRINLAPPEILVSDMKKRFVLIVCENSESLKEALEAVA